MEIIGIICEYNPFHLGHRKQLDQIRKAYPDSNIVCLMSGSFVQRGAPAILDKMSRAKAAVLSGADLVLELPTTASLSSAEGFAAKGVAILSPFCTHLCFGAESREGFMETAEALLRPEFPEQLHLELSKGLSFPAARQAALEAIGVDSALLSQPNNILAVEYCKGILAQNSPMIPMPVLRQGNYHDTAADAENPSATALRQLMSEGADWKSFVPKEAAGCLGHAVRHTLAWGERAVLAQLRRLTESDFEALPYGSEGLWRKLMHAVREQATLEEILTAVKSKRYTRTRLDRMVMCAYLGITKEMLDAPVPYVRVLALNEKGRDTLKMARKTGRFPNIGEIMDDPYQLLEERWGDLYGLFAEKPEPAGLERRLRVYCQ